MHYSDDRSRLQVEIEAKDCDVAADERTRLTQSLDAFSAAVQDLPATTLRIEVVLHRNSNRYHAKFRLKVPGRTLFASGSAGSLEEAFQQGRTAIERRLSAYRQRPDREALEIEKQRLRLENDVLAPEPPDPGPLAAAIGSGDYLAFRNTLIGYEDWLRLRIGRWIQRDPEAESRVGRDLLIGDVVEEVYLNAFEQFTKRPPEVPLHDWLAGLIDPSVKALLRHPDQERENASFARSLRETPLR